MQFSSGKVCVQNENWPEATYRQRWVFYDNHRGRLYTFYLFQWILPFIVDHCENCRWNRLHKFLQTGDLRGTVSFTLHNICREKLVRVADQTGEILADLGSDQTSCHNPYHGGYYPVQVSRQALSVTPNVSENNIAAQDYTGLCCSLRLVQCIRKPNFWYTKAHRSSQLTYEEARIKLREKPEEFEELVKERWDWLDDIILYSTENCAPWQTVYIVVIWKFSQSKQDCNLSNFVTVRVFSLRRQMAAINALSERGMFFWDYGNAFLLEASRAGR